MGVHRLMKIAAVVVLLLTVIIIAYTITLDRRQSQESMNITLPETSTMQGAASDALLSDEPDIYSHLKETEIEPENIKSVIATLHRSSGYSLSAQIERFYGDKSKTTDISHWVVGGYSKTEVKNGDEIEHILCGEGAVYRWMDGDTSYYKSEAGSFTHDDAAEFPTYETVLDISEKYITKASYTEENGSMYVLIEYFIDDLGYTERYYISIDNGLLMKAETYDSGELIYSMNVLDVSFEQPPETVLMLPSAE